ncbi:hypothetical protein Daesc_005346 [Daldinia eschscholtzii]|uniref:Uncharacterized protein n=1 Tax=Daldinia eschscholtzii TaxID=292717 RepID=A0AAX6MKW7_9PEZI
MSEFLAEQRNDGLNMSSNDNGSDSDLEAAIKYLITRSPTPKGAKTGDSSGSSTEDDSSNTEDQHSSAEDQSQHDGSKTVRWAEPVATQIPNSAVEDSASKSK